MVTKYTMPAKVIFTIDDEHADMVSEILIQLKKEGVTKICRRHDHDRGTIIEGFTCGKTEDLTPASDEEEDAEEGQDPVQGSDSGTPEVGGDPSDTEVVEP